MTGPFSSPARSQRGFTLLELLVATAVGAIVLLVINATFFSALRLHNSTHDRIDEDLALQRTLGIVRRDLEGVMLPGGVLSGTFQTETFSSSTIDGTGDRVSPDIFTSSGRVDGWTPFSEVQMVAYFLSPATDGTANKSLVRVVTRNLLPAQEAATEEQVLLPGVASASLEFYDGTDWTDVWDSTTSSTLPGGFRFRVTLAARDNSQLTPAPVEMIVPIIVMTAASQQAATAQ
jgi:type II secretion system protein J